MINLYTGVSMEDFVQSTLWVLGGVLFEVGIYVPPPFDWKFLFPFILKSDNLQYITSKFSDLSYPLFRYQLLRIIFIIFSKR